jgi:lipoprotein-anchoring transpeptidase ErfK/SrfK
MSRRGNINYKYLRRRKSWFRRNLRALIAWAILIIVVAAAVVLGAMKIFSFGLFKKNTQNEDISQEPESQKKEVVWIEDKEPESTEVVYTPPADVELPYFIMVNRAANCVTVYGIDSSGEYSIPVKAFAASCGREGNETITGENYTTTDKYEWRLMVDGTYGHYAFRISGGYLFHSVPYVAIDNSTLETAEYNKLGSFASLGCVRMCVRDVKWLYDNCPSGTKVTIYDDASNPGPLGKPESIKIPEGSENASWDPTDPNPDNPWLKCKASITGAEDITVKVGEKVNLKANVHATDTCGNDITDKIITIGRYTFDQEGEYDIKYKVTDAIGSVAEVTVKLKVTQ